MEQKQTRDTKRGKPERESIFWQASQDPNLLNAIDHRKPPFTENRSEFVGNNS